ncbi:molybdate ABC transporter substrate-binding protein [uncultured Chitinophaga sp.]|jgi:molybdenum ABC transporter, periplasmic molybdate-binding protein|uniref:molybdate ABC transporter substrate-binding protein n=1 Tax=uncultured Chitinophaga sp. TaxID=339340 RepID=UPI0026374564|nr:molybdate ABC transporter substrate-binding protein [uncultured Chitinophaga sp.]
MTRLLGIFLIGLLSCQPPRQEQLTLAVAANMQYTIQSLIRAFNKTDSTKIAVISGASGNLTQQILNGAPFDIFISAEKVYPRELARQGLTLTPPQVYARGQLVLWSARPGIEPGKDLQVLLGDNVQRIAIANPATAPYGHAAVSLLKKYALYDQVKPKLVTGESITQASQFIATQHADIGFTAKAVVMAAEMKGKGKWVELDVNDYPAIEQAAALLTYARHNEAAARKFYHFLYSEEAKAIYKQSGYLVP